MNRSTVGNEDDIAGNVYFPFDAGEIESKNESE